MSQNFDYIFSYHFIQRAVDRIYNRLFPARARCFSLCKQLISEKIGLEIGGPSSVFSRKGILPIYPLAKQCDNCNFSHNTIWEGFIIDGRTFKYDRKRYAGNQYICEATNLNNCSADTYDFILSSHVIEHIANPLLALSEWLRILKVGGVLILLVPHKDGTFDHRRPLTTIDHLMEDFRQGTNENNLSHLGEILELHDLEKDPGAGTFEAFKTRSVDNAENRCLHHHVFDTELVLQVLNHMRLQILSVEPMLPYHIVAIAQKLSSKQLPDNHSFFSDEAEYRQLSPFVSDSRCPCRPQIPKRVAEKCE